MALADAALESELLAILNDQRANKTTAETAAALKDAIANYVKTGQVVVAGGSSAGTYPVT